MAFKDEWVDKIDGVDINSADDINQVAHAIIDLEENGAVDGENGATFTPSVSAEGVISWTNDQNLPNPEPVNIKGPKGDPGENGKDGTSVTVSKVTESTADGGSNIITFSDGNALIVKNGSKGSTGDKGDKGDTGATGATGAAGKDGKSAYAYAQDGGYTGTEAEFSAKLATPFVTPQMFGAKGDGSTNDTKAIQDALDSCSIVYIPDGIYMVDAVNDGIEPNSNQRIILSPNAILRAIPNGEQKYRVLYLHNVTNVHISGGIIEGEQTLHTGTDGEWGFGIEIKASSCITVENIEIFNCWGDCICTGYNVLYDDSGDAYDGEQCENISIINCKLHDARRQGISVCSGIDMVIRDCEIYNIVGTMPQSGIDIEPDWVGKAKHLTIDNCYIHNTEMASIIVAGNIEGNTMATKDDIRITDCRVDVIKVQRGITKNVCVSDTKFTEIHISCKDTVRVDNCKGEYFRNASGNAIFTNCEFESNVPLVACLNDGWKYAEDDDKISFVNCKFTTSGSPSNTFFIKPILPGENATGYNDRTLEFINCEINLDENTDFLSNRAPGKELKVIGCTVRFSKTPTSFKVFYINNLLADLKLTVYNSHFIYTGTDSARTLGIVEGNAKSMDIDFAYNTFHRTKHFLYCGSSSGTARILNNNVTVESTPVLGTFTISGTNKVLSEEEITALISGSVPSKTSQLTNDSGFITADDIPEAQVPDLSDYALKSSAETWTFTLADGSTVTKKVVLA